VEGQQDGWPAWTWVCFGCCVPVFAALAAWELRADRRGGNPLLKPGLLRQTSFSAGAIFAIAFFGGFSSVFFTLSILWQVGLGHSALITGLVIAPFSVGTLVAAANSDKLSAWLGRKVLVLGCPARSPATDKPRPVRPWPVMPVRGFSWARPVRRRSPAGPPRAPPR